MCHTQKKPKDTALSVLKLMLCKWAAAPDTVGGASRVCVC